MELDTYLKPLNESQIVQLSDLLINQDSRTPKIITTRYPFGLFLAVDQEEPASYQYDQTQITRMSKSPINQRNVEEYVINIQTNLGRDLEKSTLFFCHEIVNKDPNLYKLMLYEDSFISEFPLVSLLYKEDLAKKSQLIYCYDIRAVRIVKAVKAQLSDVPKTSLVKDNLSDLKIYLPKQYLMKTVLYLEFINDDAICINLRSKKLIPRKINY